MTTLWTGSFSKDAGSLTPVENGLYFMAEEDCDVLDFSSPDAIQETIGNFDQVDISGATATQLVVTFDNTIYVMRR